MVDDPGILANVNDLGVLVDEGVNKLTAIGKTVKINVMDKEETSLSDAK